MSSPQCFSLQSENGLINQLITPCHVCIPTDINGNIDNKCIHQFNALWDTGATGTVITKNVVDALSIKPSAIRQVFHANGDCYVNAYQINVILPNGVGVRNVVATEGILNGFDLLIGMDIITLGDFSVTNHEGKTCFSFRIPSIEKVDFVEKSAHTPVRNDSKIGRNDPCPCGNGKKYKNCHGKNK